MNFTPDSISRPRAIKAVLALAALGLPLLPHAAHAETQRLSATVDGKAFEGDDDTILYLTPTKGVLNLRQR